MADSQRHSHPLLSIVCSVLLPVLILNECSAHGGRWYDLGPVVALCVALSLPLLYGAWILWRHRGGGLITLLGIVTTLLTGLVTVYAQTGPGESLRPSTPWFYAAKEAALPFFIATLILLGGTGERSLLRVLFYTDELFHTREVEARIAAQHRESDYRALLGLMNCLLAGTFLTSAVLSYFIALHFQLPLLHLPAEQQAVAYNYAVGNITFWSWLIISIPVVLIFTGLFILVPRKIRQLTQEAPPPREGGKSTPD